MNHCLIFNVNGNSRERLAGGHRIASHLRNTGWDCEVIDFLNDWSQEEIEELFKSRITSNSKFIGLSYIFSLDAQLPRVKEFTKWVKDTYPQLLIISGSQTTLVDNEYVDYHVTGYGEIALDTILKYKFSNGPAPIHDIMQFSHYKTKVINALHNYPAYPHRDPIIKYEDRDFMNENEWGRIEFSRGCKFKCTYCSYPVLGVKGDYTRDVESARNQLMDAYTRFGIKNWIVSDETFNDRTEKITKFADMVETLPFVPYFSGYIRADLLVSRPKDREELLRMRFLGHFYGIETFNHESAKAIKKGMEPKRLQEGMIEVKNYFKKHVGTYYRGHMAFIVGLPYETKESIENTLKWLRKNWIDQAASSNPLQIGTANDYRSSEMSLEYKKYGYREMPLAKFPDYDPAGGIEKDSLLYKSEMMDRGIVWENEHMNIFEANELTNRFRTDVYMIGKHSIEKLDPFLFSASYCHDNGELLNLEEKIKMTAVSAGTYYENYTRFVENYKRKKLDYKK